MTQDVHKTALVTGAANRIGKAIARDLASAGLSVAVHYHRSGEAARALVEELEAAGGRATAIAADLRDESQTGGLVEEAVSRLGPVTCLINNASAFEYDSVDDATRANWDGHMAVNMRAPFLLSQALSKALPADARGAVINMIDQRVWNLTPHFVTYTLSKSGLWTMTRTLAMALAPRIRVNAIGPGPTLPSARQSEEHFTNQVARTPLGRAISLDEICAAVRFILDAPSLTGQMIALDSGQHLGWQHPLDDARPDE
jgi:NAD(P)-dependent dehydrogenase (short-subunit alcohol dehydrogenase family)